MIIETHRTSINNRQYDTRAIQRQRQNKEIRAEEVRKRELLRMPALHILYARII